MANPQKQRGDRAEVALVHHLAPHWPLVRRTKAGAEADLGDIVGVTDRTGRQWAIQVADRKWRWPAEVETKAAEAARQAGVLGAERWCLIAKRAGTTDVGRWWCWLPVWALGALLDCDSSAMAPDSGACYELCQVTVRTWLALTAPLEVSR